MIQSQNSQEDYFKGIVWVNYNNDDVYEMLSIIAENDSFFMCNLAHA